MPPSCVGRINNMHILSDSWVCVRYLCVAIIYASVIFTVSDAVSSGVPVNGSKNFIIFDATLYKEKPDYLGQGIIPLTVIYEKKFWPVGSYDKNIAPDERFVRKLAKSIRPKSRYVVLDIESWPIRGYQRKPEVVEKSIENYLNVLKWFKQERPDLHIGYFGFPKNNYIDAQESSGTFMYGRHMKEVRSILPILTLSDAAYPSAYTFEGSFLNWTKAFLGMLKKLKMHYQGKIYVFMSPDYIDASFIDNHENDNKPLPDGMWRKQLEFAYDHVDGVVIWGGWKDHEMNRLKWDGRRQWWSETKAFIKDKNLYNYN